nr:glycosyltransferase family A protein [Neisseria gonorrhoeae]
MEKIKELRFKGYTIISKQNGGLESARNEGIRNATGKYIIVLDSDDIIHRDYIKNLLEVITIQKHESYIVRLYCLNTERECGCYHHLQCEEC